MYEPTPLHRRQICPRSALLCAEQAGMLSLDTMPYKGRMQMSRFPSWKWGSEESSASSSHSSSADIGLSWNSSDQRTDYHLDWICLCIPWPFFVVTFPRSKSEVSPADKGGNFRHSVDCACTRLRFNDFTHSSTFTIWQKDMFIQKVLFPMKDFTAIRHFCEYNMISSSNWISSMWTNWMLP